MNEQKIRDRKKFILLFLLIWLVLMAVAFYFCTRKEGFHEDEYYTYYSTARTNGFFVEDGEWIDRDSYRNEFVVLEGQRFQYGLVKLVQSWDVHPPVYYWVFHTAQSLFPGAFSKWIGLSVNLIIHGVNIILLTYMSYLASGRDKKTALFVTFFYGLTPAAISGVTFIRMYELLTMWVLLCAILHVKELGRLGADKLSFVNFLLPLAAVTYLGFLTQYYYFIFLFFLAFAFCVYLLWRDRNIYNCLRYGISLAVAFVLAYLTYPSCLGQMFRGQRGAQATENFFDLSNTAARFQFFLGLLNEYVFGKMLPVFLLLVLVLFVTGRFFAGRQRTEGNTGVERGADMNAAGNVKGNCFGAAFWLLFFTVAGYFLAVSKTALLLGGTSVRYQMPVYGIIVLLIFRAIAVLWERVKQTVGSSSIGQGAGKIRLIDKAYINTAALIAAAGFCLVIDASGLLGGKVEFLYPEDEERIMFAEKNARSDVPAVYLYPEGADWCIWDTADELFEYPQVYFASAQGADVLSDKRIGAAPALVLYLDKGADKEVQIERILKSNSNLRECELKFEEKYCDVYYFY